jgi:glucose-6-phosphate 1-dehydrogenase
MISDSSFSVMLLAATLNSLGGDFSSGKTFGELTARLDQVVTGGASANRLFYCSRPPALFPELVNGLRGAGLADESRGWSSIVVEKPFGRDLASARWHYSLLPDTFPSRVVLHLDTRADDSVSAAVKTDCGSLIKGICLSPDTFEVEA